MSNTVGLAIIAKDEAERLPTLLKSVEGAFDEIVLVDTGSTDDTIQVFLDWVETQHGIRAVWDKIEWTHDFSAARRHAQSLQTTDWQVWADCDDEIVGAQNIRRIVENTPAEVVGLICGYNYIQHPETGSCLCYLKRERIVRAGHGRWQNRVHEAQVMDGPAQMVPENIIEWVHRKQLRLAESVSKEDVRRNLDILENWIKDEPENGRVLVYLGVETQGIGDHEKALEWFDRYFSVNPDWDEERAQAHRKAAVSHLVLDNPDRAQEEALKALTVLPSWTDSYLTMAEVALYRREFPKAIEWATEAIRRGKPETMLIINPLDYTFAPRKIKAMALAEMRQFDAALAVGQEALSFAPDPDVQRAMMHWRSEAKIAHTANHVCQLAQQLVAHDEQLAALTLLEQCVPHFVVDHPQIVQARSQLRERLSWIKNPNALFDHYENGGSKPEDFLPDDKVWEVAAALPRTQFLYQGIHEQLIAANREGIIAEALVEQLPAALESING